MGVHLQAGASSRKPIPLAQGRVQRKGRPAEKAKVIKYDPSGMVVTWNVVEKGDVHVSFEKKAQTKSKRAHPHGRVVYHLVIACQKGEGRVFDSKEPHLVVDEKFQQAWPWPHPASQEKYSAENMVAISSNLCVSQSALSTAAVGQVRGAVCMYVPTRLSGFNPLDSQ
ncbi:hypothetical protein QOT17_001590 [Balamuthia mandrillaris]